MTIPIPTTKKTAINHTLAAKRPEVSTPISKKNVAIPRERATTRPEAPASFCLKRRLHKLPTAAQLLMGKVFFEILRG